MEVDERSDQKSGILPHWLRLKNEFTEDEKCHNLMSWFKLYCDTFCRSSTAEQEFFSIKVTFYETFELFKD